MRTRMKDIAQDLGVSLMTVSKALRSHSDISEETRRRVMKRARELNYHPNWIARSLVTRRTYMVGLIIPDLMHSFFAEVAKGVARKFEPLGYQIVISNSEENADTEVRQLQALLDRNVDGVIIASAETHGRGELFRVLESRKVPYVLIDRMPTGFEGHYVGVQDEEIGALATKHLIDQGCQRIAHLKGPANPTGTGRLRGYRRALAKQDLEVTPEYIVSGAHEDGSGYEGMRQLLQLRRRPDGVFCYNDPVAAGAIKAILEAGLRVPEDIAVIGAGNVHYSDLLRIPLSTVDQSSTVIGETAAELLAHCIEEKKPIPARRVLIPPRLVVRESSRRN
ncbi:MAG TPA: LacI family DNA-binding transcriptional regulator [Bryobacteraceae bacterium]|nr:LacI family DNA-binding transcriptional regulator [Bryobacteraceae bacterium]